MINTIRYIDNMLFLAIHNFLKILKFKLKLKMLMT